MKMMFMHDPRKRIRVLQERPISAIKMLKDNHAPLVVACPHCGWDVTPLTSGLGELYCPHDQEVLGLR